MKDIKPAVLMLILFTVTCGGIYPLVVTGIAQALFPKQANGSFITDKSGKEIGSILIGQPFSAAGYFWPRPSATEDFGYNLLDSGGSNLGPTNPDYLKTVGERVRTLHASGMTDPIPAELAQASASGLDPHISPEAALLQVQRVAKARGVSQDAVTQLVARTNEDRQFGFLGAPRINVLVLNLELDRLAR